MTSTKMILLRFESKNGQFRLSVNPTDEFPSLLPKVVMQWCLLLEASSKAILGS